MTRHRACLVTVYTGDTAHVVMLSCTATMYNVIMSPSSRCLPGPHKAPPYFTAGPLQLVGGLVTNYPGHARRYLACSWPECAAYCSNHESVLITLVAWCRCWCRPGCQPRHVAAVTAAAVMLAPVNMRSLSSRSPSPSAARPPRRRSPRPRPPS